MHIAHTITCTVIHPYKQSSVPTGVPLHAQEIVMHHTLHLSFTDTERRRERECVTKHWPVWPLSSFFLSSSTLPSMPNNWYIVDDHLSIACIPKLSLHLLGLLRLLGLLGKASPTWHNKGNKVKKEKQENTKQQKKEKKGREEQEQGEE